MDGKVVFRFATNFVKLMKWQSEFSRAVRTRSKLPMSVTAFWNVTMMASERRFFVGK